ncbi:MAG: protein tyrosine phosphatase family protein, partial [bacterium]
MKKILTIIMCFFPVLSVDAEPVSDRLLQINNFHFVSEQLASSGQLKLLEYDAITDYGFKHVINLVPGEQQAEREKAISLGLTYEQIEVDWSEPTLDDFERFKHLMHKYGQDKVYVHCELNYRASTFVYLYRIT